ncbi:MAG: accessory factor UbiK family protein, partial [Porticoccaceae bacterium]|nr:accessory factor UbiK family protein [Porticoccaceae bacterium]
TLSGAEAMSAEMHQLLRAAMNKTLSNLDVVTREEFDTQQAVLVRSREKIDVLEKQIAEIETLITKNNA